MYDTNNLQQRTSNSLYASVQQPTPDPDDNNCDEQLGITETEPDEQRNQGIRANIQNCEKISFISVESYTAINKITTNFARHLHKILHLGENKLPWDLTENNHA